MRAHRHSHGGTEYTRKICFRLPGFPARNRTNYIPRIYQKQFLNLSLRDYGISTSWVFHGASKRNLTCDVIYIVQYYSTSRRYILCCDTTESQPSRSQLESSPLNTASLFHCTRSLIVLRSTHRQYSKNCTNCS